MSERYVGMHLWLQCTELKWAGGEGKRKDRAKMDIKVLGYLVQKDKKCWKRREGLRDGAKYEKEEKERGTLQQREGNWGQLEERWIRETKWEIHMGPSLPRMLFYSQHFLLCASLEIQSHRQRSEAQSWVSLHLIEDIKHCEFWNNLYIFLLQKGNDGNDFFFHTFPMVHRSCAWDKPHTHVFQSNPFQPIAKWLKHYIHCLKHLVCGGFL